ncbi:twin-arginine translocase TatA/TatE family subunit [Faecalibacter sp. WQ 117]|uniref:Twin-arginine translocase TatA/TatE family subunit n=2 Tax=Faecalibacter rhinopitheci TaxID=2779678 RepID=A0A8J7FPY8_9FLAO|nr:twin-arginine translocase TatA/TatE family subunit [Faecalibacter rhinopitheci]MBQ0148865.1 twin-arginine translocase TatA/TatE family subunit [Candidatus Onthonaster equi]
MIILVVAVVIFGPDKIPEIARGLGQGVRKMKEATEDIKQEILNPAADLDPTKEIRETIKGLDPTEEIKNAFVNTDPSKDIARALEDPLQDFENSIMKMDEPEKTVDPTSDIKETIQLAKTEIEIASENELGNGGSISR